MTLAVRVRLEAARDLTDAAAWYEARRPGLGHRFLDEVAAAVAMIAEAPLMFPNVHRNTRRTLIRRFPFGIYYRIEESEVVVVAVMHASRHPRRWQRRT